MKAKILIVEDQFIEANNLKRILKKAGYTVCSIARSVKEALAIIEHESPELVLLDIQLDGLLSGIDLGNLLRERNIAFVYLSANSDANIVMEASATKPYGFLVKPFREKDVLVMLDVAWYLHQHQLEFMRVSGHASVPIAEKTNEFPEIIGKSECFMEVLDHVKIVAPSETSVLIQGESGTGKELIAMAIHRLSIRKKKCPDHC